MDTKNTVSEVASMDGETTNAPRHAAEPTLGVALSGGGIRAALFSLGVLMGLVEMGANRQVTHISSVSGGSITNAAVAQAADYSGFSDPQDFAESVAAPLARVLSRRGAFFLSGSALWSLVKSATQALAALLGPLLAAGIAVSIANWSDLGVVLSAPSLNWLTILLVGLGLVVLVVGTRGRLQEALYGATLASLSKNADRRSIADFAESRVIHVLVSTDLVTGEPVYFSRTFACSPPYGWGSPRAVKAGTAVYASAAFPVVFPPKRLRRKKFDFQNGDSPPPYPRLLKLTDGGVHNNLGTGWFDELGRQDDSLLWKYGSLDVLEDVTPCVQRIVVNAGAASQGFHRVWPLLSVRRTMSVLYDNTVQPRLAAIRKDARNNEHAPIVLDISESPIDLAATAVESGRQDRRAGRQQRADIVTQLLMAGRTTAFWDAFALQTSSTRTKLTRAGMEAGARMVMHGYLSAVIALHIINDVDLPPTLHDEGFFLDLAGRPRRDRPNGAGRDETPASEVAEPAAAAPAGVPAA